MLLINAKRNGYAPDQCGNTMTIGELINYLEDFNQDEKIYLSHDKGYTYGSITQWDFEEREEIDEAEDEEFGGVSLT
jgi:hypothetical protein